MKTLRCLVVGLWSPSSVPVRRIAFPLLSLGTALMLVRPCMAIEFENTGSLAIRRAYHTLTLLQNGKVLVVGGSSWPDGALASAEIYDPVSGTWSFTGSHWKVLVAGGFDITYFATASAELGHR